MPTSLTTVREKMLRSDFGRAAPQRVEALLRAALNTQPAVVSPEKEPARDC